jgi:hypothetical protein
MFKYATIKAMLLALTAMLLGWSNTAFAQATCGITGSSTASPAIYDPFSPTGLATTQITLNLTRVNGAGGQKTDIVNFYLRSNNSNANGVQIIPRSAAIVGSVTGFNQNIFYNNPGPVPTVAPTSLNPIPPNNFLKLEFTGNNAASDTAAVVFDVMFPANLNLNASTSLAFDAIFACSTTGGGPSTQQTGSIPNAVVFPVTVLSALQASFAGTALDFGEVGTVTNLMAPTTTTGTGNYVRVQSSGAYVVTLSSQNAYRLKHPTGSLAVPLERIAYSLRFLGQTKNNVSSPTTGAVSITQNCARAGVGSAFEDRLYLMATLDEGGQGKTPSLSGNYTDILTVTITPQSIATSFPTDCNAFTVP